MTDTAAYVVRQSQGTDDSVSLETQREEVGALARELADETVCIDLGVHTGYSHFERGPSEAKLDDHPEIEQLRSDLQAGRYDYLCALDDARLARDQFLQILLYDALQGDCDVRFVRDIDLGDLSGDVKRVVEREVKKEEIEKSKAARERWAAETDHEGRPPYGLQYDDSGTGLEPGPEFEAVCEALGMLDGDATYAEIESETGIPTSTIGRLKDRREMYEAYM